MMMSGRYFLCFSLFLTLIQSSRASEELKNIQNTVGRNSSTPESSGNTKEDKPKGIFSRRHSLPPQGLPVARPRPDASRARPSSVRHCTRLRENCSVHFPCCHPCAVCHCRIFNTICQCWRVGVCPRTN